MPYNGEDGLPHFYVASPLREEDRYLQFLTDESNGFYLDIDISGKPRNFDG